jgi:glycosyltransferase involved in cell wall biosynthesis
MKANAGKDISLLGKVSKNDVSDILKSAWVLVFPSVREGFGLSIIEANAHATPAVGYDVAGVRDAIQDGLTGILVPDNDVVKFATAICSILGDASLRQRLSRNALEYSKEFSWDETASKFEAVLNSVQNDYSNVTSLSIAN